MTVSLKVARPQTALKPSETFRNLSRNLYTTTHRTFQNLPEFAPRNQHQHTPEPPGTFRNLPQAPTPAHADTKKLHQHSGTFRNLSPKPQKPSAILARTGTLRNRPEHSPRTCTRTPRNPPEPAVFDYNHMFKNKHMTVALKVAKPQTALKPSETFRNLSRNLHHRTQDFPEPSRTCPPEPTPAYAATPRNLPELASSTYTSTCRHEELHQHSGTFRNLSPETSETFRNTSTHRNPPEPLGTFLQNLRPHTPELIWAEDTISLRCWRNTKKSIP